MRLGLDLNELGVALRRAGSIAVFGVLPVVVVVAVLGSTFGRTFVYDFHGVLYDGGRAVLKGINPYPVHFLDRLASLGRAERAAATVFAVPVYPAPALVVASPFSLLSVHAAGVLFTVISIAAFILGLRLLGVRDWRCYGLPFLTWPLLHSLRLGQVNGLLVLGCGVVWYWRRSLLAPAAGLACMVAVNLFLWPLGFFMLITRRFKVAAISVALFVALLLSGWAVIGFAGLGSYPKLLSDLSSTETSAGVSYVSAGLALGASRAVADAVSVAVSLGLLGLAWLSVQRPQGENRAYGLAVLAGLASSPVVWPHYMVLVFVPIALLSPRLSILWAVPFLAYLAPVAQSNGDVWRVLPYLAIQAIVAAALIGWRGDEASSADPAPVANPRLGILRPDGAPRLDSDEAPANIS
jgi:Glycosyltransferase family 87